MSSCSGDSGKRIGMEPMRKHLLAISVFQWVLTFLLMGIFFTVVLVYMLFTSLWLIPVVYFTYLLIDWDTPERGLLTDRQMYEAWRRDKSSDKCQEITHQPIITGGRRTVWVRRWTVWKYFRDYFPIKVPKFNLTCLPDPLHVGENARILDFPGNLLQCTQLSPDRNYVLGCHPHGIFSTSAFCNFATEANGISDLNPGVRPWLAVLAGIFRLPIYRDYIMSAGIVPVSKDSLKYLLSRCGTGNAVFIVVGGAAESLHSNPGEHIVTLSGRKGFVRLALENGADLVPVYSFGETDIYEQLHFPENSWRRKLQIFFKNFMGFAPCLFIGTGVFSEGTWGLNPFPRPVTSVVGRPIRVPYCPVPSEDEVSHYHQLYIQGLQQLFEEYKVHCGLSPSDTLQIV